MVWDSVSHELIVGDEKGFIGVWNVYHERPVFLGRIFSNEQRIINLSLRDRRHELIVTTETDVLIYRMKRE